MTTTVPSSSPPPSLPPGPTGDVPLRATREDPLGFLAGLVASYGDLVSYRAGGEHAYLLNHPDHVRHVLRTHGANYTKAGTPDDLMLTPLLGKGLLTSTGETWARQRRLCAPAFRRSAVVTFDGLMTDAARGLVERWLSGGGRTVRVDRDLSALTLQILMGSVLGADTETIGEDFERAVDAVNRFLGAHVPDDGGPTLDASEFARARRFMQGVTATVLASRRATGAPRADLLSAMMAEHDRTDTPTDEADLRHQVLTLIMAGHETTAKALTWTLALLDAHPAVLDELLGEIDGVLGGRIPDASDPPRLAACRRAVQEAMRLYPPAWLITRRALADDVVGGHHVPAGLLLCISPYLLHRHPSFWEEPGAYRPGRFLTDPAPQTYLPFGGGDRLCVGQHFAMAETVLVLAVLLPAVRFTLAQDRPVTPEALVTLRPLGGLTMTVTPR